MMKRILAINLAFALLSSCAGTPKLPDPTVQYPAPPAKLMEPPRTMGIIRADSN